MKKNLKMKSIITIITIGIMIAVSTVAYAVDENYAVGMALKSDSKLKEGDTVTVNINLTSIKAGDGVDSISAEVNYDKNVFETISTTDITSTNGWIPTYSETTKMITFYNNSGSKVKDPSTVATIKFKVKSSINVDSTTVTFKDTKASGGLPTTGGTGDINVGNLSVTINKEKQNTSTTDPTPTPTPTPTPGGTENKINNITNDTTTTKKSTLPKTGIAQYGTISIVVVVIIAIFSYVLYKKIAKDVK